MTDISEDVVDMVHQVVKAICKKKGYLCSPNKEDVRLTLTAIFLIRDTAEKGES